MFEPKATASHLDSTDRLAFHHGVGDARQFDDFRSDRLGGLLEGLEDIDDTQHPVVGGIGEFDHGELDNLVAGDVETGRFDVDGYADPHAALGPEVRGMRHEAAQHPVVGRRFEPLRQLFVRIRRQVSSFPLCIVGVTGTRDP
jgi:hypothetical protein